MMENSLIPFSNSALSEPDLERIREIISDATAENTRRAYRSDLTYWAAWAQMMGLRDTFPMPPDLVVRFISDHLTGLPAGVEQALILAGIKRSEGPHAISTIERRVYALSSYHRQKGLENPLNDQVIRFLRQAKRAAVKRGYKPAKKRAATRDLLDRFLATCGDDTIGIRDAALLSFGFSTGGRRRSEIVSADLSSLTAVTDGYIFEMGASKTNKTGAEQIVPVLGRGGEAVAKWLELLDDDEGPIFRRLTPQKKITRSGLSDKTVARILKSRALQAGFDPDEFGAHSLRSGFMTEGGRQNVNIFQLMEMSGHKSVQTAKGYFQAGNVTRNPAAHL